MLAIIQSYLKEIINIVGNNATKLNQGLQVTRFNGMYRPGMTQYEVMDWVHNINYQSQYNGILSIII